MVVSAVTPRRDNEVVHRTTGRTRGPITRLMSPSDIGALLKPFVFLDYFDFDNHGAGSMPLHPHSGIATVTVLFEGEFLFTDPSNGKGVLGYGGVEWMRAGGGVWHGKEMTPGSAPRNKGFQLWLALPAHLESGQVDSQYVEASGIPDVGPAKLILGEYGGAKSPVRSPEGLNYLMVRLAPGQRWTYERPTGHSQAWLAPAAGSLSVNGDDVPAGQLAVLSKVGRGMDVLAGPQGASFVLGSALPHPHDLVLGYYSVHTSQEALEKGEAKIDELGERMQKAGFGVGSGPFPVFAG